MATGATIRRGSTGPDVIRWQLILGVTPDGSFGPITESTTKTWQAARGLVADGVVGPLTWGAATDLAETAGQFLNEVSGQTAQVVGSPSFLDWGPSPTASTDPIQPVSESTTSIGLPTGTRPTLRLGSTGEFVSAWQKVIGATPDGMFGQNTDALTKAWQTARGLVADGVVGPLTWGALDHASPVIQAAPSINAILNAVTGAASSSSTVSVDALPTIRRGSSGEYVVMWQGIIGATPDGMFGPNTESMTKSWQGARGLVADGVVGPLTWGAAAALGLVSMPKPGLIPKINIAGMLPDLSAVPLWAKLTAVGLLGYAGFTAYTSSGNKKLSDIFKTK